ncbi:MAG: hypothetical protein N2C14_15935 [Planctomycetales bacterium]
MAVDAVFHMHLPLDENWPHIIESENRYDFSEGGDLATGEIDQDFFDSVRIHVEIPKGLSADALKYGKYMLLSERAKNLFASKVADCCAPFVRVMVNDQPYFILVPTRVIDCLDKDRSEIEHGRLNLFWVLKWRFNKTLIPDTSFFEIPKRAGTKFVTSEFKKAIEAAGLNGFRFLDFEKADRDAPGMLE